MLREVFFIAALLLPTTVLCSPAEPLRERNLWESAHRTLDTLLRSTELPPSAVRSLQIVNSPYPNAYTTPEGEILVSRGLLDLLGDDDELAFVLAHELAHLVPVEGKPPSQLGSPENPETFLATSHGHREALEHEIEADRRATIILRGADAGEDLDGREAGIRVFSLLVSFCERLSLSPNAVFPGLEARQAALSLQGPKEE